MNFTNQLGELTELLCQIDFLKRGINLSKPINPSSRYDFIADINGELTRIQCKTADPQTEKTISIRVYSKNCNTNEKHDYLGEVDYFYTNWNNIGYLIPIDAIGGNTKSVNIRIKGKEEFSDPTGRYSEDFIIDKILQQDFNYVNYNIISIEERKFHTRSEKLFPSFKCIDCGKPVWNQNCRCPKCAQLFRRISTRPSREVLKNMIRNIPFTIIGKNYNVTDNAIRKWCRQVNLPYKKSDIKKYSDEQWEIL